MLNSSISPIDVILKVGNTQVRLDQGAMTMK